MANLKYNVNDIVLLKTLDEIKSIGRIDSDGDIYLGSNECNPLYCDTVVTTMFDFLGKAFIITGKNEEDGDYQLNNMPYYFTDKMIDSKIGVSAIETLHINTELKTEPLYAVGDVVEIKSLDEIKLLGEVGADGDIYLGLCNGSFRDYFTTTMFDYCGKVVKIIEVNDVTGTYKIANDPMRYSFSDKVIVGKLNIK